MKLFKLVALVTLFSIATSTVQVSAHNTRRCDSACAGMRHEPKHKQSRTKTKLTRAEKDARKAARRAERKAKRTERKARQAERNAKKTGRNNHAQALVRK